MAQRYFKIKGFCEYIGLGQTKAREWGEEHKVVRRIGKSVFYDKVAIDKILDELGKEEANND